jgi:hypothetical protein
VADGVIDDELSGHILGTKAVTNAYRIVAQKRKTPRGGIIWKT